MTTKRDTQKNETRDRIRQAAKALFVEKGADKTTIRDIARAAGVATGTVNLHFGDKLRLMHDVIYEEIQQFAERALATLPEGPTLERLMYLVEQEYCFYEQNLEVYRPLVKESFFVGGSMGKAYHEQVEWYVRQIAGIIEEGVAVGELRGDLDPYNVAWAFASHYFMGVIMILRGERFDKAEAVGFVRMLAEQLFMGLEVNDAGS